MKQTQNISNNKQIHLFEWQIYEPFRGCLLFSIFNNNKKNIQKLKKKKMEKND